MKQEALESIARLREEIASLDKQILGLVARRLAVAEQIGHHKKQAGLPVRNFKAEVEVLERARVSCAELGLDPDVGQALLNVLIEAAVGRQHDLAEKPHDGPHQSVLVVGGCGRMGDWLCHFFTAHGHRVTVYDSGPQTCEYPRAASLSDAARAADVIVLAVPITETAAILETLVEARPRGLIFDICSLKSPVLERLHHAVREGLNVASVHPMFAPDTVLLSGRVLVVCDCGNPAAAEAARAMFEDTALRIVEIPLDQHDEYMAYVLGLSHAVNIAFARALATSGHGVHDLDRVTSTTFARQSHTTRQVASENPRLYYEIQRHNAHTASVLKRLTQAVTELEAAALSDSSEAFVALMQTNRRYFEGLDTPPEESA